MEVAAKTPNGADGFKGILTMEGDDSFTLEWCRWECFLLLISSLEWRYMLSYLLPYCLGIIKLPLYDVESETGNSLVVIRPIKYG